jgi:hypothetical protein
MDDVAQTARPHFHPSRVAAAAMIPFRVSQMVRVMLTRDESVLGQLPLALSERIGAGKAVAPRLRALVAAQIECPGALLGAGAAPNATGWTCWATRR